MLRNSHRRATPSVIAGALLTAALLLLPATAAQAHVSVTAEDAEPGAYTLITFAAPTESSTESTVRLEIALPTDTPFGAVRTVPTPGWSSEIVIETLPEPVTNDHGATITEAATHVVLTADSTDSAIRPGELGLFTLSVGPLPDASQVVFPVLQVYDSGREVYWSQQASGAAEPELPAPVLELTAAPNPTSATDQTNVSGGSTDALGVLGLIFGVGGLVLGGGALAVALGNRRRPGAGPDAAA